MAKTFRPYTPEQRLLFPPSVEELLSDDELSIFIRDLVREELDLSAIVASYKVGKGGKPPYDPAMMTALLLYSYAAGVYSSRKIARACRERVTYLALTGMQYPDFRRIAEFRARHLGALSGLFVQVLHLCQEADLVKLGHVSLDGSKVKANASKHKAMSYGRMDKREKELKAEVEQWLKNAGEVDAAEDEEFGRDKRGDELPDWVKSKEQRRQKIAEAKKRLEQKAKEKKEAADAKLVEEGKKGRKKKHDGVPHPKEQVNFTDPDSRIMKTKNGFDQCYNGQIAVDSESQVIVSCALTNCGADTNELENLVEQMEENCGEVPKQLSADAGYCSEENLRFLRRKKIAAYVATRKEKRLAQAGPRRAKNSLVYQMWRKLRRAGRRSRYRLRKAIVEPVFGQIKHARGFRSFLLRGLDKVKGEWTLVCIAHNLRKLATTYQ